MYNNFTPMLPDNAHTRKIMKDIRKIAEAELDTDIKSLPYSKFKLFQEAGSRTEYENDYMEHRRLLAIYGLMCLWEEASLASSYSPSCPSMILKSCHTHKINS